MSVVRGAYPIAVDCGTAGRVADGINLPVYQSDLSARRVDRRLRRSLAVQRRAEECAVLWFAEVLRRRLYRELGFVSIHQYAAQVLGFSSSKTYRFLRLATDLERLPLLQEAMVKGEIGWSKAHELTKVAGPRSEERWITEAKRSSRRELAIKVARARRRAAARRKGNAAQGDLTPCEEPAGEDGSGAQSGAGEDSSGAQSGAGEDSSGAQSAAGEDSSGAQSGAGEDGGPPCGPPPSEALAPVTYRFSPMELAHYDALIEKIRKSSCVARGTSREQLLLLALDALLASPGGTGEPTPARPEEDSPVSGDRPANCEPDHRVWHRCQSGSSYKIIIYQCSQCRKAHVHTSRGEREITPAELAAAGCDAEIERKGERNRTTVPPSVRREVLARDRHRCRAPGCKRTQFLEMHHVVPRAAGGSNRAGNIVTLCSGCHRLWHECGWGADQLGESPGGGDGRGSGNWP